MKKFSRWVSILALTGVVMLPNVCLAQTTDTISNTGIVDKSHVETKVKGFDTISHIGKGLESISNYKDMGLDQEKYEQLRTRPFAEREKIAKKLFEEADFVSIRGFCEQYTNVDVYFASPDVITIVDNNGNSLRLIVGSYRIYINDEYSDDYIESIPCIIKGRSYLKKADLVKLFTNLTVIESINTTASQPSDVLTDITLDSNVVYTR